jgi:hypothetical protein
MKKKSIHKKSMRNNIFRYLQRYLEDECKKIIHQNKSLGLMMQVLKPEEEYVH